MNKFCCYLVLVHTKSPNTVTWLEVPTDAYVNLKWKVGFEDRKKKSILIESDRHEAGLCQSKYVTRVEFLFYNYLRLSYFEGNIDRERRLLVSNRLTWRWVPFTRTRMITGTCTVLKSSSKTMKFSLERSSTFTYTWTRYRYNQ